MLMVTKFIGSIILSIGGALAIANIEQTKIKIGVRQILWILALTICTIFFSKVQYSVLQSLLMFMVMILAYKEIFNFNLTKAIIMTAIVLLLASIGDVSALFFTMNFVAKQQYHTNHIFLILANLYTALIMYLITKPYKISTKINKFINKAVQSKIFTIILEVIISVILMFLTFYNVYDNFQLNFEYIINLLIYVLVGVVLVVYIKESNNYTKLLDEYDKLLEYVQTFEEWIEEEQLELHESKNSLSVIYDMKDIKEVRKELDKLLNRKTTIEDNWVTDLKPIPKGGLKGLLYYKFMIAKNNNLNLITDVSDKVTTKMKRLSKSDAKLLFRLVGIYFDNAIEAATESKNKNISLEVYKIKNELNVVITNTYKDDIDLNKIGKKGVSTKGENRGKGTYLAKKLVSKNDRFEIKNTLLNNYYIQKIIIK